jgi:hypothetical protein
MRTKRAVLFAALLAISAAFFFWLRASQTDLVFRGQPESVWIQALVYRDEPQAEQWRKFGPKGVHVLMRALDDANRPFERDYRKLYHKMAPIAGRFIPHPRMDSTRARRMTVCDLLCRLGKDAAIATPAMIRELDDEEASVRQIAINFFTLPEDQTALLNQMDKAEKQKLLPTFIRDIQDSHPGLRINAAVALGYYSEQTAIVVPILVKALQDSDPQAALAARASLNKIDPKAATNAGVK